MRNEVLGQVAAEFDAVHSVERAKNVGSVHEIISAAALFSFLISRSGLPGEVAAWVTKIFESPIAFLLAVNVMLLIVGMFIET